MYGEYDYHGMIIMVYIVSMIIMVSVMEYGESDGEYGVYGECDGMIIMVCMVRVMVNMIIMVSVMVSMIIMVSMVRLMVCDGD